MYLLEQCRCVGIVVDDLIHGDKIILLSPQTGSQLKRCLMDEDRGYGGPDPLAAILILINL